MGQRIYLVRNIITWPAVVVDQHTARRVMLDQVGKHHLMEETVPLRHFRLLEATRWRDKWGPPRGESAAYDVKWMLPGDKRKDASKGNNLVHFTIKHMTRYLACKTIVTPAAKETWNRKIPVHQISRMWKIKTYMRQPGIEPPGCYYNTAR